MVVFAVIVESFSLALEVRVYYDWSILRSLMWFAVMMIDVVDFVLLDMKHFPL